MLIAYPAPYGARLALYGLIREHIGRVEVLVGPLLILGIGPFDVDGIDVGRSDYLLY